MKHEKTDFYVPGMCRRYDGASLESIALTIEGGDTAGSSKGHPVWSF